MVGAMRELSIPFVLYDHDGFASDDLDAEPTIRWADNWWSTDAEWNEAVMAAGPPFYGVAPRG